MINFELDVHCMDTNDECNDLSDKNATAMESVRFNQTANKVIRWFIFASSLGAIGTLLMR